MIDITRERPLQVKKAAAFMDVSTRTIERWFLEGLEKIKLGGKVYTTKAALQRFGRRSDAPSTGRVPTPQMSQEDADAMRFLQSVGAY